MTLRYNLEALKDVAVSFMKHPRENLMMLRLLPRMVQGLRYAQQSRGDQRIAVTEPAQTGPDTMAGWFDARDSGRGVWKWRHYLAAYDQHFLRFRNSPVHIVEIGVYSGGSLEMWRSYLGEHCHVYGVDIREECRAYENDYTRIFIGDQADRGFWAGFKKQVPRVDILIDDGGHRFIQQSVTFEEMLHHIAPGGIYVCEDLHRLRNPFAAYLCGLMTAMHDMDAAGYVPGWYREIQCEIQSVAIYPYLAVVTKHASFEGLQSVKKGMQWQPFLG